MIGRTLRDRYRLYDRLGAGNFASVFLARDLQTNEVVAIKILHPQHSGSSASLRRFEREASLVQRLHHPNVVRMLEFGREDDLVFLVLEYVQGHTLAEVIERRGKVSVAEAVDVAS